MEWEKFPTIWKLLWSFLHSRFCFIKNFMLFLSCIVTHRNFAIHMRFDICLTWNAHVDRKNNRSIERNSVADNSRHQFGKQNSVRIRKKRQPQIEINISTFKCIANWKHSWVDLVVGALLFECLMLACHFLHRCFIHPNYRPKPSKFKREQNETRKI